MTTWIIYWGLFWLGVLFVMALWKTAAALAQVRFRRTDTLARSGDPIPLRQSAEDIAAQSERNRQKEEQSRAAHGRAAARAEFLRFCEENARWLQTHCPPAFQRAFLNVEMNDSVEPTQAWAACREFIHSWQPLILQEKERQQAEEKALQEERQKKEEHARRLQADIQAEEAAIQRLRQAPLGQDTLRTEVAARQDRLQRLRNQQRGGNILTPEDLRG